MGRASVAKLVEASPGGSILYHAKHRVRELRYTMRSIGRRHFTKEARSKGEGRQGILHYTLFTKEARSKGEGREPTHSSSRGKRAYSERKRANS